ncbi:MAG: fatty acid desaturase [Deltaproteobacteria bacterium]|nr:fatty acid desaturase [Deltaproteobacteria bacterium]
MSELRAVLRRPNTAWPTIALAAGAVGLAVGSFVGAAAGVLSYAVAAPGMVVAAFVAFTPMHDAAHGAVARKRRTNEFVGRLCSVILAGPYAGFRWMHFQHHGHTNDAELDPDNYSGRGPTWALPLRWLTQDLHYYWLIIQQWGERPASERREIALNLVGLAALVGGLCALGYGAEVIFVWLLPVRVALGMLAFTFDYLPHSPYEATGAEDRYRATRIIEAPFLTVVLLQQNYHLIHHLYPAVPFYRYRAVYRVVAPELAAKGARVTQWGVPREVPRPRTQPAGQVVLDG